MKTKTYENIDSYRSREQLGQYGSFSAMEARAALEGVASSLASGLTRGPVGFIDSRQEEESGQE